MKAPTLQPWMRGPFELIRHADGHVKEAGDTDRRIALIGFDNAIEVCIDVFINLHPKLRKGIQITTEEKNKMANNYHAKIEFLDKYVQAQNIPLVIPFEAIVWYHQLRNELYHSGNGMVPEMHVLEGAELAAIAVFQALFDADISSVLGQASALAQKQASNIPSFHANDQMEFLRAYIDFEKTLSEYVLIRKGEANIFSAREMWSYFAKNNPTNIITHREFEKVSRLRNNIVHGRAQDFDPDELSNASRKLDELTESIRKVIAHISKPT